MAPFVFPQTGSSTYAFLAVGNLPSLPNRFQRNRKQPLIGGENENFSINTRTRGRAALAETI